MEVYQTWIDLTVTVVSLQLYFKILEFVSFIILNFQF